MAIQTQGFGVNVIPQYTPVDPRLVAFNPAAIPEGVLSSFNIADTYKKLQAFDKAQKELDATRTQRIAATGSGYDAEISDNAKKLATNPLATQALLAKLQGDIANTPKASALEGLNLDAATARAPIENAVKLSQAQLASDLAPYTDSIAIGKAQNEYGNLDQSLANQTAQVQAEATRLSNAAELATPKQAVDLQTLHDQLTHGISDMDTRREQAKLHLELVKAQIEAAKAKAKFDLGEGRQTSRTVDTLNKEIAATQAQLKNLSATKLPDGRTLDVYKSQTFDANGKPIRNLILPDPVRDPQGDALLKNKALIESRLNQLIQSPQYLNAAPQPASPQPQAPRFTVGQRVKQDGVVYEFNGSDFVPVE